MRLIDADSIEFTSYINGDITVSKEKIQNMTTAFDLESVIKQLEELEKWNNDKENCKFTEGYACAIDNALEIIKSALNAESKNGG